MPARNNEVVTSCPWPVRSRAKSPLAMPATSASPGRVVAHARARHRWLDPVSHQRARDRSTRPERSDVVARTVRRGASNPYPVMRPYTSRGYRAVNSS